MSLFSPRFVAITQVLISGIAFGTLGVFGKFAFAAGLRPGEFLAFRFAISSVVLLAFAGLTRPRDFQRIDARMLATCAALGVLGYAVFSSFYFEALSRISASLTVLLLYTYPILVGLGSRIFFGERLTRQGLSGLALASLGLVFLVGGDLSLRAELSGLAFGLGSALVYSLYILGSSHFLRDKPVLVSCALIQLAAGIALFFLHLAPGTRIPTLLAHAWPVILATALIATALAMSLFLIGLQKLRATEVSLLSTMEPISAVFLAGFILSERLGWLQMLGGLLVLAALVVGSLGPKDGNRPQRPS
jgi:drug/metabolite transporter (DMT)-like permease